MCFLQQFLNVVFLALKRKVLRNIFKTLCKNGLVSIDLFWSNIQLRESL